MGSVNWHTRIVFGPALVVTALVCGPVLQGQAPTPAAEHPSPTAGIAERSPDRRGSIARDFGKLPLSFERNQGQADLRPPDVSPDGRSGASKSGSVGSRIQFLERRGGHATYFAEDGVYLSLVRLKRADRREGETPADPEVEARSLIRLSLVGSREHPEIAAEEPQAGKVNYFIGNDSRRWLTNVPTYGAIRYKDVYPGIDIKFYGNNSQLEYDVIVRPGANPDQVRFAYDGVTGLAVEADGSLTIALGAGSIHQNKPRIYQEIDGRRVERDGRFTMIAAANGSYVYGFDVPSYDNTHDLVIDPTLVYSTYLGGNAHDHANGITVDADGNVYVVGETWSLDFPAMYSFRPSPGTSDVFVTKLAPDGALVYSSVFGNSGGDYGTAIAVDGSGNAWVTGQAGNSGFPAVVSGYGGLRDAFVTKLSKSGVPVFTRFLGGAAEDGGEGIVVDGAGNAYVTGWTSSDNFPTIGAFQTQRAGGADAFVTAIRADEPVIIASSYLGGTDWDAGRGIALDAAGNAYVTGETYSTDFPSTDFPQAGAFQPDFGGGMSDVFVAKIGFSNGYASLWYWTYLGGSLREFGRAIAVDRTGSAYVTGYIVWAGPASGFPTRRAFQSSHGGLTDDAFIAKLNPSGTDLIYSSFLGGTGNDRGYGIAVDAEGSAYVIGETSSADFPVLDPFQGHTVTAGYGYDAFVTKVSLVSVAPFEEVAALRFSTFFGGGADESGRGVAIDGAGTVYVAGRTYSDDFPTSNPANPNWGGYYDAFVAKIFDAVPIFTHSITGTITANGAGLGGVSVLLGGLTSAGTTTAGDGTYRFDYLRDGIYVVTPERVGSTFSPASALVTIAGADATQDFTAAPRAPVILTGPDYSVEGQQAYYQVSLDNQRPDMTGPLTLDVEFSPNLAFASEWADEWACAPGPAGHRLCTWNANLPQGAATSWHQLTFNVTGPPYAANCGPGPSPCVTVRATLISTGDTAIVYTGIDNAGGTGNSIPRATDDVAWVYGELTFSPLGNDWDPDNDPLTIAGIETPPAAGVVVVNSNGTVTYTANDYQQSAPDSLRYRVTDGRGGSAIALVSINSVTPVLTSSKPVIDAGPELAGRLVSGWTYVSSAWGVWVQVAFEPVGPAGITAALAGAGYDAGLAPQAVSDPGAFRGDSLSFMTDALSGGAGLDSPTRWTQVYYRPSQTPGRISVARAVFSAYYMHGSSPGTLLATTSAYAIGMSGVPAQVPVIAADDLVTTAAGTPVEIDVLANDTSQAGRELGIPLLSMSRNWAACIFDGICDTADGLALTWTPDGRRVVFTPLPGFAGTTGFTYGVRETPCPAASPCSYDDNTHYATVTVRVTPPDLSMSKEVYAPGSGWTGGTTVSNGLPVSFRVTVTNALHAGATTGPITVVDTLAAGLTFDPTQSDPRCAVAGQVVTCVSPAVLAAAQSQSFMFNAVVGMVASPGQSVTLTNTATVSTPNDTNPANDTSNTVSLAVRAPDLSVSKQVLDPATQGWAASATVANGAQVSFRLTVSNAWRGSGPTSGPITVVDTLPAGLTFHSGSPDCTAAGQVVTCESTRVLAGTQWLRFTINAVVGTVAGPGQTVTLTNSATVSTPGDEDPANDTSNAVTVTVQGPAGAVIPGVGTMLITVPPPQTLSDVAVTPSAPTPPPGVNFPFGAISYTVTLGPGEASSSATMTFTPPLGANLNLYKSDDTGGIVGLIPVCNGTTIVTDCWTRQDTATSTTIVLTLTDNGPFDLNSAAGVIEDPVLFGFEVTNSPPVADAGPNLVTLFAAGLLVRLDGSASHDPFNNPLTYAWTITSAPDGSAGTVLTGVTPSFTPGATGLYEISLVVNDGALDSAPDAVVVRVVDPPTQLAVTPVVINNGTGDQYDPHVDGDLASYSETTSTLQVRYYRFSTGVDSAIPGSPAASDLVSDVSGDRIAFTRIWNDRSAIMLFDAASGQLTEVNPQPGSDRMGVAIGGSTLAYVDQSLYSDPPGTPRGEIFVVDLTPGGRTTRLTSDIALDFSPKVSSDGWVVVWQRCLVDLSRCGARQAVKQGGGGWAISDVPIATTGATNDNPSTDGTVVTLQTLAAATDRYDFFHYPVSGARGTHLRLPGDQTHPGAAGGFIVFEHRDAPTQPVPSPRSDLWMYEIATGRFFQITATPDVDESLNDVTVLSDGGIRIVWDANDDPARNVYAATVYLPDFYLSAPPIPAGVFADGVSPDRGTATTLFTFKAVYTSRNNLAPQAGVAVVIDGTPHDMAPDPSAPPVLQDGDYTNGEQYTFTTALAAGMHDHYFKASDGRLGRYWPDAPNPPFTGPVVSDLTVTFVPCLPTEPQHVCSPRFVASGGTGPYTYTGFELPAGVAIDPATGVLSGEFAPGTYTLTIRVTDANGDVYDWVWIFTIADTVAPVVTAPPDVTLLVAEGSLTPLASLGAATAVDDVSGVLTPTASPAGPFPPGFHLVTWSASDAAGNTRDAVQRVTLNTPSHVYGLSVPGDTRQVDLSVPPPQTFIDARLEPPSSSAPPGVSILFGVVSYTVRLGPGQRSATTSIGFTPPLSLVSGLRLVLYKVSRAGVESVIPVCDGATIVEDCWTRQDTATSTIIVLTLTDNGPFDLASNIEGVIEDPVLIAAALNRRPTANAGSAQTLEVTSPAGASVTLSGTGSDPDADALTFSWSGACGSASTAVATLPCPLGTSTMTLTVTDSGGLSATASVSITVRDTTPPTVSCGAPDTAWHAGDVTIACSAVDSGSGLVNPAYDASFGLSTSTVVGTESDTAATDARTVCDVAGNCTTAGPVGPIKIDKKAPAITMGAPVDGATYIVKQKATVSFSCTDGAAGVATCGGTAARGASLDTASVGTKPFTVTTADAVGNQASATATYTVLFAGSGKCLWNDGHAILFPIQPDGSSAFPQGLPVLARFRVCDAQGQSVGTPGVVSNFKLVQTVSGGVGENLNRDVPSVLQPPVFRWSPLLRDWEFLIDTRGFVSNTTYFFRVTLADATFIDFSFAMR